MLIVLIVAGLGSSMIAQTITEDMLLLELVSQQSLDLHRDTVVVGDSVVVVCDTIWQVYPHPLCVPLMYIPEVMPSLSQFDL